MGPSSAQPTAMALGLAHQEHSQLPSTEDPEATLLTQPTAGDMEEVDYESLPTDRLSAHLLAGGAAGMMEHCCMYPVDCVKVWVGGAKRYWGCGYSKASSISGTYSKL